jgi:hypothetical protein
LKRGYKPTQIHRIINEGRSEEYQVTREAIYNDIKVMEKEWMEAGVQNFNAWRMRIVDEYLDLKRFLWEQVERSMKNKIKIESENIVDETEYEEMKEEGIGLPQNHEVFHRKARITEEMRDANPAYTAQIIAIEDKIAELMGLKGPNKIALTDPTGNYEASASEAVMAILERMANNNKSKIPEMEPKSLAEVIDAEIIEDE